ncbi:hypothetical protein, partial [Xanthomonas hortorum]|uniref:hypothetical protein n=1 Tax=Xanthomonas hortorum TaxID=56454 RepID=UPI0032E89A97
TSVAWITPQHEAGSVAYLWCVVQRFPKATWCSKINGDKRQATSDKRQATSDKRQATSDKRQASVAAKAAKAREKIATTQR